MISKAQEVFDRLSDAAQLNMVREVFCILEYDEDDGEPGSEWSSDTLELLSDVFNRRGITWTDPNR